MTRVAIALAGVLSSTFAIAGPVEVGPGTYRPALARKTAAPVAVARFLLDEVPVTNAKYLAFVRANPTMQRGHIKRLFADPGYLARWRGPLALGDRAPATAPVVEVSWFAARAYCAWRGGRLPREAEWELAATAISDDASLAWYASPVPDVLPAVGGPANPWGVRDLHGLVWEWVEDYSAAMISGDGRDRDAGALFCGGGAAAADPSDYAAFMRLAFRSSLQARYTTQSLGFRCAYDPPQEAR